MLDRTTDSGGEGRIVVERLQILARAASRGQSMTSPTRVRASWASHANCALPEMTGEGQLIRKVRSAFVQDTAPFGEADRVADQLEVLRQHRGDIRAARALGLALLAQLSTVAGNRGAIVEAVNESTEPGPRRVAMVRAVQLQSNGAALRDLATALRQLNALERQAYGIDAQPIDTRDSTDHVGQRVELAELEAAIERTLNRTMPTAEPIE